MFWNPSNVGLIIQLDVYVITKSMLNQIYSSQSCNIICLNTKSISFITNSYFMMKLLNKSGACYLLGISEM